MRARGVRQLLPARQSANCPLGSLAIYEWLNPVHTLPHDGAGIRHLGTLLPLIFADLAAGFDGA